MNIFLHDADSNRYPNLPLMKLSAYHKAKGNKVYWFTGFAPQAASIFSSKVFTFSKEDPLLPKSTERGGTGYSLSNTLPDEIEHSCPDYALYNLDYSMGFLTRGCPRSCSWCFVPEKEGNIVAHADIDEFICHQKVILMDNNVLAHGHGIDQLSKLANLGLKVDFNQGLDAKLIDDSVARLLSKIKWATPLRLACDHVGQIESVRKAVELLRWHNTTPRRYFCYLLVRDICDAVERVRFLKTIHVDPFAQPFLDKFGTKPTEEQRHFARWVNHKAEFKSRTWEDYRDSKLVHCQ